jgi:hypothetical protein
MALEIPFFETPVVVVVVVVLSVPWAVDITFAPPPPSSTALTGTACSVWTYSGGGLHRCVVGAIADDEVVVLDAEVAGSLGRRAGQAHLEDGPTAVRLHWYIENHQPEVLVMQNGKIENWKYRLSLKKLVELKTAAHLRREQSAPILSNLLGFWFNEQTYLERARTPHALSTQGLSLVVDAPSIGVLGTLAPRDIRLHASARMWAWPRLPPLPEDSDLLVPVQRQRRERRERRKLSVAQIIDHRHRQRR